MTTDPGYAAAAVTELTDVVGSYGGGMSRSKALCLTMLATSQLIDGDVDQAVRAADDALTSAEMLNSGRFTDRLRPLREQAHLRRDPLTEVPVGSVSRMDVCPCS